MSSSVKVTLGGMGKRARAYVEEGRYSSMSEVVQAGLCALQREEAVLAAYYKAKVAEALSDERPRVPLDEAIERVLVATADNG